MISNGMSGYALINLLLFARKKWMMLYLGRETMSLFVVVELWFRFVEYRAEKIEIKINANKVYIQTLHIAKLDQTPFQTWIKQVTHAIASVIVYKCSSHT